MQYIAKNNIIRLADKGKFGQILGIALGKDK